MWPWVLQRVTGILILGLIGLHFWVTHYAVPSVTFGGVVDRLRLPIWFHFDLALLAVILYHALNGVRTVVLDFNIGRRKAVFLDWGLVAFGVALLAFGSWALLPFRH